MFFYTIFGVYLIGVVFYFFMNRNINNYSNIKVDVIVAAYNEEKNISTLIKNLISNNNIDKIICVDDGSTDKTLDCLKNLHNDYPNKLKYIHKEQSGKSNSLMEGLKHIETEYVFITDADMRVPNDKGLMNLIYDLKERGYDATGGISGTDLERKNLSLLYKAMAAIKIPCIGLIRIGQKIFGTSPFLISGCCGLFKTSILRKVGISTRTQVEDLDLTWDLVSRGFKVSINPYCIVYSQESTNYKDFFYRYRRWIVGYVECLKLYPHLLFTRFFLFSILPTLLIGNFLFISLFGLYIGAINVTFGICLYSIVIFLMTILSVFYYKNPSLLIALPIVPITHLLISMIWMFYGIPTFFTKRNYDWVHPERI